jgi:hypothetical protein
MVSSRLTVSQTQPALASVVVNEWCCRCGGVCAAGGGNVLNVQRTVRQLINVGAKGCFLEDQKWPKKTGRLRNKEVISMDEFAAKVGTVVARHRGCWGKEGMDSCTKLRSSCCYGGCMSLSLGALGFGLLIGLLKLLSNSCISFEHVRNGGNGHSCCCWCLHN